MANSECMFYLIFYFRIQCDTSTNFDNQQNTELYDPYDAKILGRRFEGHQDAVWSLAISQDNLLSCSADESVKLWSIEGAVCKHTYTNENNGTPNDVAFHKEQNKVLITWTHQILTIVDIEAGLFNFVVQRSIFDNTL